ncbi:MAG: GNAT family N-acetyltransferase [Desulfobacterales bacterium]|nr:GNAT family N-acetyltransferase [Desulfobacterales bacterium]
MIKGKQISLRTVRKKDVEQLFELESNLEYRNQYFMIDFPSESQFSKDFDENGFWSKEKGRLLIVDDSDTILGWVFFYKGIPYFDGFEIGYLLYKLSSRGKGIGTEAVKLFVQYLFELFPINRIHAITHVDNESSKKMLKRIGFKFEGITRQAIYIRGKYTDAELWSVLRSEWLQIQ